MNSVIEKVTQRIIERSKETRAIYLQRLEKARKKGPHRGILSCGNIAHGYAACSGSEKSDLKSMTKSNVGIISSYNDMLSAHEPYGKYPDLIKSAVYAAGGIAQFAGGVPAMCDGVTQGQPGMELSLFSRDTIALSAAIGLSHNMFDSAVFLGICDKIVPGLFMSAVSFGHLPCVFIPAGPMPSGLPNSEKARIRQEYAQGKVGRDVLLECESQSYHSAGTCTFYGTANSNQMVMEIMGLHLPGSSFVNPGTPLRDALTAYASKLATRITDLGTNYKPFGRLVNEKVIVNGIIGLLTTGGSTNHTMHLIAMAKVAGIQINWDDMADLSKVIPSLAKIYPNGQADINHFHAAGGVSLLVRELLDNGLLHEDVETIFGNSMRDYTLEPFLDGDELVWREGPNKTLDSDIISSVADPFSPEGGIAVFNGNLGRAVIKKSAVKPENRFVEAPCIIFDDQDKVAAAFKAGTVEKRDMVVVVRFQGPRSIGMPELHKLTPHLGALMDEGYNVALVTDGRMSGASGKIPSAIHLTPGGGEGGPIAKLRDGDVVRLDANNGELTVLVDEAEWSQREAVTKTFDETNYGMGRELFSLFRDKVSGAEEGATIFRLPGRE